MASKTQALRSRFEQEVSPPFLRALRAYALRVPLAAPVGAGGTALASRDYLCVEADFSDDSRGIGFSYIGTLGAMTAIAALEEFALPVLTAVAAHAGNPFAVHDALMMATRIQGRAGILMNVISAVDIALWDAAARRGGVSLARLLGSDAEAVQAYGSGGYYFSQDGLEELPGELRQWQDLGFSRIKLKVRGDASASEQRRLAMAREAMGDGAEIMLDFYHAYTDRQQAWRFVQEAAAMRPYWIEDPFAADDLASFAWLSRRSGLRLATGEFQSSPAVFDYIGEIGAAAVIQAEAPRCGGVTGWLRVAESAERFGMTMHPCWFHQLHAHLVPSVPNGGYVEYFHGTRVLNFDELIDTALVPENGRVILPKRPGLGFNFRPDALGRYTIASRTFTHAG